MSGFLRRLAPRTLLARTFLLVAVLIVVTVAIWAALLSLAEREPRARQLAQLTASAVNITRAAIIAADPARRRDLLVELSEREGIHLYPAEADDEVEPLPDQPFYDLFREETRKQLGSHTRLGFAVNGEEGIWASFRLDDVESDEADDEFWVMLPRERADRRHPWHWLGWGGASMVLALLVAWLIVSRVTRPLRTLSRAAEVVGKGRRPEAVPEAGAEELRQLARSFNQMSEDLARIEVERAEVLAGISHDLRTPLARLRLEAELSVADDAAREAIAADIEQMDAIIAQFLDYARGEPGELPQETELAPLLDELAAHYARVGVAIGVDCAPLPPAMLYPLAIRRGIANLIENARKYGDGEITLRAAQDGSALCIDVMDRGPGIPPAEVERLKRPFTRLESARTDAKGTGLGLAIVERIARLHGGHLELLPRDGGGLLARLRLAKAA